MGIFSDFGAPGRRRSGRRRRANARCGWPDVEPGLSPPCPRGFAAVPGCLLIFNRLRPAIRPARIGAPRRRHVPAFGTTERPCRARFLTALQQV